MEEQPSDERKTGVRFTPSLPKLLERETNIQEKGDQDRREATNLQSTTA